MGQSGTMMETPINVFMLVLIAINIGEAKDDLDIMKEMMVQMNHRVSIAEERLMKTEDELAAALSDLMSKNEELERVVSILRNLPFIHSCGSHYTGLSISS